MISLRASGSTKRTDAFLDRMVNLDITPALERYAQAGVDALRSATPLDSGLTAHSWTYEVVTEGGNVTIWWTNTNVIDGFNVAIGLQYGHGTRNGGYVAGRDYINPALKGIFDKIADDVWKEVQRA